MTYLGKWCPFVRADNRNDEDLPAPAVNVEPFGGLRNPFWSQCIGPECAVWDPVEGRCGLINQCHMPPAL